MIYALASVTGISCVLFGVLFYQMKMTDKKILQQISLIARALRTNISETKSANKKLDLLRASETQAAEFQKKSSEQQRMMLASLNKQLQRLEIMYVSNNRDNSQRNTSLHHPERKMERSNKLPSSQAKAAVATPGKVRKDVGVVRLEEIFQNRSSAVVEDTNAKSSNFMRQALGEAEFEELLARRASNG